MSRLADRKPTTSPGRKRSRLTAPPSTQKKPQRVEATAGPVPPGPERPVPDEAELGKQPVRKSGVFRFLDYLDALSGRNSEETDPAEPTRDPKPAEDRPGHDDDRAAASDSGTSSEEYRGVDLPRPHKPAVGQVLAETLLLYALMITVEFLTGDGAVGAWETHPHPYWLIIIPIAAVRGVAGSLVASFLGTILYAKGGLAATESGGIMEVLTLTNMREPMLFFAVSFVIGEFHDALLERYQRVWRAMLQGRKDNELLIKERDLVVRANLELKRQLVDDSARFNNLIDSASRIESADEADALELALEMIQEHCGATACSALMILPSGSLDLAAERGWGEDIRSRLSGANESTLVRRALAEGMRVNGFSPGEPIPVKGPLIVAPLTASDGSVKGLLCLDEIPASRLNDSTVLTFYGIHEWINASMHRVSTGRQPIDLHVGMAHAASMTPWLGTPEELGERVRIEDARCARQGIMTSLLAFQAVELAAYSPASFQRLDDFLLENFSDDLRPSDSLYRFGYPGCYLALLPGASGDEADLVRVRIVQRAEYVVSKEVKRLEVTSFSQSIRAPDLQRLVERVAEHFRRHSRVPLERESSVRIPKNLTVGTLEQFARRVKFEWSIALRHDSELYVIDLRDANADADTGGLLARHMTRIAGQLLRDTDGIYHTGRNTCSIILPAASCEGAFGTMTRILEMLVQRLPEELVDRVNGEVFALGEGYEEYRRLLDAVGGGEASAAGLRR